MAQVVTSQQLVRILHKLQRSSLPFAMADTLTAMAKGTVRTAAKDTIPNTFILRNNYSVGSLRMRRAHPRRLESVAGTISEYMAAQETGGAHRAKGKHGVRMALADSSGEARNTWPRRRKQKPARTVTKLLEQGTAERSEAKKAGHNRRQRNLILVKLVAKKRVRTRMVFMETSSGKFGMYRIHGRRNAPQIEKMHDFSKTVRGFGPKPWLLPAAEKMRDLRSQRYWHNHLAKQINRLK